MKNRIAYILLIACTAMFSLASSCDKDPVGPDPIDDNALIIRYGLNNCYLVDTVSTSVSFDVKAYPVYAKNHITASKTEDTQAPAAVSVKTLWIEDGFSFDTPAISDKVVTVSNFSGYGNGLVAIYDAEDNLLWSYHIWRPKDDPTQVLRFASMGAYVMPMALGATEIWDGQPVISKNHPNYATTAGLYYQFGRKDPLGRADLRTDAVAAIPTRLADNTLINWDKDTISNLAILRPFIDAKRTELLEKAKVDASTLSAEELAAYDEQARLAIDQITILTEYARLHPTTFIKSVGSQSGTGWYYYDTKQYNKTLWYELKSCYDPCPDGYMMVNANVHRGFLNKSISEYDDNGNEITDYTAESYDEINATNKYVNTYKGLNFYYFGAIDPTKTTLYAAAGYRAGGTGAITAPGTEGRYLSYTSTNTFYCRTLHFKNKWLRARWGYYIGGTAGTVRCMVEMKYSDDE